jgi:hypothetical protein
VVAAAAALVALAFAFAVVVALLRERHARDEQTSPNAHRHHVITNSSSSRLLRHRLPRHPTRARRFWRPSRVTRPPGRSADSSSGRV